MTPTSFEPTYSVKVITGVRVKMRDGVELNVKIIRPDAEGRFPAVMEYSPYRSVNLAMPHYHNEIPPVAPYLAERGYVIVKFEVRGTGNSSGFSTDIYSDDERQDGYDMVEWIAAQDWCTGAVGMIGISYGAVVQWHVAMQQPPHLKALVFRSGNNDVYTDFTNPGGAIRPWMFEAYAPHMNASNFAPPLVELTGDRWEAVWNERLQKSAPWSLGYIRNLVDGPYWQSKSLSPNFERVQCPVFFVEGWADWYASQELLAFQRLSVPKKALIGPWGHYYLEGAFPGPRIDGRREYLKWFDRWLKGIDNGVMDEPSVTVFVRHWKTPELFYLRDEGHWQNESHWPPQRVTETPHYFAAGGELRESADAKEAGDSLVHRPSTGLTTGRRGGMGSTAPFGLPIDQRLDEPYCLLYTTQPLAKPIELLGEPRAVLFVSSTADTAYFHVKLCDVAPDGTSKLISDAGLLASHRHSHQNPEPMIPGEVYELRFALRHLAYRVEAGHRLRILVASADFQNAWPTGAAGAHTVHRGAGHPSHVVLPISPAGSADLAPPEFTDTPNPLPDPAAVPKPEYMIHMDIVNDTVACELTGAPMPGGRDYHSRYVVSNRDPARATIESRWAFRASHPSLDIRVRSDCKTSSDPTSYAHEAGVEILVDGKRHFQKSWTESVPRRWS